MLAEGPAQHFLDRGNDIVDIQDLRPYHFPAGEGEQLAGEPGRPFGGQLDLLQVAEGRVPALGPVRSGRGGQGLGNERGVVEDHGEQVVEVVGHPAGQLAQVFQSLGLLQLRLHALFPAQGVPPLAPHDKPFLGVPALLTGFHVTQFLGVPRVPALLTGLHVKQFLRVPRVPAVLTGLHIDLLLGVARVPALLTGPHIELLLRVPALFAAQSLPALALHRIALVGVPRVPALLTGLHVKQFLRVPRVPALLTGLHVKQFLRVPRVPALLTGLHIDLLLGVPRVPALLTGLHINLFLRVPRVPAVLTGLHIDLLLGIARVLALLTGLLTAVWPGPLVRTRLARLGHVNHPRPPSCA